MVARFSFDRSELKQCMKENSLLNLNFLCVLCALCG